MNDHLRKRRGEGTGIVQADEAQKEARRTLIAIVAQYLKTGGTPEDAIAAMVEAGIREDSHANFEAGKDAYVKDQEVEMPVDIQAIIREAKASPEPRGEVRNV